MAVSQKNFAPIPSLPREVDLGVIELWSGAIIDIPQGWILCDGTQGTPDLRNLFVVGSGTTYNPGDTGGSLAAHTHDFTGDGHTHDIPVGVGHRPGTGFIDVTNSTQITGTTDSDAIIPPYYSLAYVMFIGH